MKRAFEKKVGEVVNVRISRETATRESRGFGFIQFVSRELVAKALTVMNGFRFFKRQLRVTPAVAQEDAKKQDKLRNEAKKAKQLKAIQKRKKNSQKGITARDQEKKQKRLLNVKRIKRYESKPQNKGSES